MGKKSLSSVAVDVIRRCAQEVGTTDDELIEEFESEWVAAVGEYTKALLEFCCSKAIKNLCTTLQQNISDGFFTRFTFQMMLALETPTHDSQYEECVAKEAEDRKIHAKTTKEQDDTPLFYSDIMPLLVDNGPSVSEDAFVWLAALAPLAADIVNARFTFEALAASTANMIHFPAYDRFVKEIDKCVKHLQNQARPQGVELADDEFILHVEGTASTQRVVRHIGGTNWPGRCTLTNYALYFEPSGVVSYESALKIDLSKDINLSVKPTATGPWGAPLFDKAIVIESSELQEGVIIEFPELTSSTRRDLWLALVKEISLLHQFLVKFDVGSNLEAWEMHSRTILGIIRLHAAREMLRMSPPVPKNFLIFALCDELPKGDFVLEELSTSLKMLNSGNPCDASTILRSLNVSQIIPPAEDIKGIGDSNEIVSTEKFSSLENTVNQARDEAREMDKAKVTVDELKEEGISHSARVLLVLLEPVKSLLSFFDRIIRWERPGVNIAILVSMVIVIYKGWVGKALAIFMICMAAAMFLTRRKRRSHRYHDKIVINTATDKSTVESIVSAQQGLRTVHEVMQQTNIALLKLGSILKAKSPRHTDTVMLASIASAAALAIIPLKYLLIAATLHGFLITSELGKYLQYEQGNRRMKEWWESIPVPTIEFTDKPSKSAPQ